MLLQLKDAAFRYGEKTVFEKVDLEINEGESVALVGRNGAGKTTLLSCICGEMPLFSGSIVRKNGLTVGYLKQNADFDGQSTVFEELLKVFEKERRLLRDIDEAAFALSGAQGEEFRILSQKYNRLLDEAAAKDAYNTEVAVRTVINGMNLSAFAQSPVSTLSGGEKNKVALCRLLLLRPELLVLDEPTNHLDYKTLDWLENFLSDRKSALLLVSHDRYFLDKLATRVFAFEGTSVESYPGNYTTYKRLKGEKDALQEKLFEKQQKEIEKLTDYIARNKARASTSNMAKSREKTLQRMERIEAPVAERRPPVFAFKSGTDSFREVLTVRDFSFSYGARKILDEVCLQAERGDKIALIGLNGTGKSTFLKQIVEAGRRFTAGIVFGGNVRVGYYDQENADLDMDKTVLEQLWFDNMKMSQTEARSLLAAVRFTGEEVFKKVGQLSGGEKAKLKLAMLMAKENNFLLLDEPTNHLDLPSREALEEALKNYGGTLLFVSHDRYLVNAVANRVAELEGGKIRCFAGNYDDFAAQKKAAEAAQSPKADAAHGSKGGNYRNAKQRAEETNRKVRLKQLEEEITRLEEEEQTLYDRMSLPEVASDYRKLAETSARLSEVKKQLEDTLSQWELLA